MTEAAFKGIPVRHEAATSSLGEFYQDAQRESWLAQRFARFAASTQKTLQPDFPRYLQIETSNICNHGCSFCAYTVMERPKQVIDMALFQRIVTEAYSLGSREVGLFSGAEPLTCKKLEDYVAFCTQTGYEYIYISTNGALGDEERFRGLLDAGLSSIKFSINGGTRESYLKTHGKDHFDRALANLNFVSEYRKTLGRPTFLAVSFVGHPGYNDGTYEQLLPLVRDKVDEVVYYDAANQSGQMPELPAPVYRDCDLPFNKVHVSVEGYLRACCNDYDNLLTLEDLSRTGLAEAWRGQRFQDLRRRHLQDDLGGTLCGNCIRGHRQKPQPLTPELSVQALSARPA